MKITRAVVPNMFTILNMFSGFMSLIYSTQGNFTLAVWFIILAAVFDGLDGVMARITKSASDFGVELDSLSDLVSFGVAPSFLIYNLALDEFNTIGILLSSLPMIFGSIRLARFNIELTGLDKEYFRGLPIPSAAGLIVTFVLTFWDSTDGLNPTAMEWLIPLVVVASLLMISTIKYDTLPRPTGESIRKNPVKFGLTLGAIIVTIVTLGKALFYIFLLYTSYGVIRYLAQKLINLFSHINERK